MWWKLTGLALIEAAAIALLFVPIKTHAVLYTTPEAARGQSGEIIMQAVIGIGGMMLLICALVLPLWLAYRIVRQRRISN